MNNVMEVNNISKTFLTDIGNLDVLKNISFNIKPGEIVSIVGPSGSGKSTLLNIISNLLKPDSGDIKINGEIGYMFQKDHLFDWRTVYKNVILGLEIKKKLTKENIDNVKNLLSKYGLIDFINHYPNELSGGMRQRIALIRTLAVKPSILLLDEAFSALDYQTRLNVVSDIYKMIKEEHIAALLVTHDITEAVSMSDKVIVLSNRPAMIKNIYEINFNIKDKTPINVRRLPEFSKYFDLIWNDLNE